MFDDAQSEHGGFPQGTDGVSQHEQRPATGIATGDQGTVADHIYPLQPVTAMIYVVAPIPYPVDITLQELAPNTQEIQQAIIASIEDMLLIVGEPGGVLYPSQLYEAILTTPGIDHFTMTVPDMPLHLPTTALPVMGQLTVMAPIEAL
jgi:uncharacterized phage protein gp47/JayE